MLSTDLAHYLSCGFLSGSGRLVILKLAAAVFGCLELLPGLGLLFVAALLFPYGFLDFFVAVGSFAGVLQAL